MSSYLLNAFCRLLKITALLFFCCSSFNQLLSQNLNDSLIVHYPLDGNANDIGPNNLNGTIVSNPNSATDCSGKSNSAFYFDGVNDYISLPNSLLLKPQLPITIAYRIKLDNYVSFGYIMETDNRTNVYMGLWQNINQNRLSVSFGDGTGSSPSSRRTKIGSTQLNVGQWYTIVIVYEGAQQITLYIDCQEDIGTHTGTGGAISYSNISGDIGRTSHHVNGYNYFKGYLDDFRMWNRALSQQDVYLLNSTYCHSDSITTTICQGDSISINNIDFYKTSGIYNDTLFGASVLGCDSVVSLDLSVLPRSSTTLNEEICDGDTYIFNGNNLTSSGTYIDTLPDANSCDSIVTLNLSILSRSFTTLNEEICDGDTYIFNGNNLTSSGTYMDLTSAF